MGRLIISESEKKQILTLYGVRLNEQIKTQVQKSTTVADLGTEVKSWKSNVMFPAGYYNQTYVEKSEIPNQINEVVDFLNQNSSDPTYRSFVVSVEISSGESRIPNTDKESGLPSPKNRVDTGFLAQERSKTIVNYVTSLLKNTKVNVKPIINTPKIGETKWVDNTEFKFCPSTKLPNGDTQGYACLEKTFNPANGFSNWQSGKESKYKSIADKFKTEQFVSVSIMVNELRKPPKPSDPVLNAPCLTGMIIDIDYDEGGHECNAAVYEVYFKGNKDTTAGTLIVRNDGAKYASLNNDAKKAKELYKGDKELLSKVLAFDNNPKDQAGKRYNRFIISNEIVQKLKNEGSTEFDITLKCHNPLNLFNPMYGTKPKGLGCHTNVGKVKITNGNGQQYVHNNRTPNEKDKFQRMVTIDSCGKKIIKMSY